MSTQFTQPKSNFGIGANISWDKVPMGWQIHQKKSPVYQKTKSEFEAKQLLESIKTGKITIEGVMQFCKWEIEKSTVEALTKAIEENKLHHIGEGGRAAAKASFTSSSSQTVNGVVVSRSNNSVSAVLPPPPFRIHSFVNMQTSSEIVLYISPTKYEGSIVRVVENVRQIMLLALDLEQKKTIAAGTAGAAAKK